MTNFLGFLGKNKIIKIYTTSQSNDRSYHGLKVFFFQSSSNRIVVSRDM